MSNMRTIRVTGNVYKGSDDWTYEKKLAEKYGHMSLFWNLDGEG